MLRRREFLAAAGLFSLRPNSLARIIPGPRSPAGARLGNMVVVSIAVTDSSGRFVSGLSKDDFEVYDDKVRQEIANFSRADDPVSLGIVYDWAGPMGGRIGGPIRALRRFIDDSQPADDLFLIPSSDRASQAISADGSVSRLMTANPRGTTGLYDTIDIALEKVERGRCARKAILIVSKGHDKGSRRSHQEIRNRLRESDIQAYAVGMVDITDSFAIEERPVLEELARVTGGESFFPNPNNEPQLVDVCARIALMLRHQYAIGFYGTQGNPEARWHQVQVKVNPPHGSGSLHLRYKDGYQSSKKKTAGGSF